ncbi:MAG: hypothetical protein HY298_05175 [Verrucomicrobia bacterium]|nr:hypothetical protein [Verrucomicrobiota bacterium]
MILSKSTRSLSQNQFNIRAGCSAALVLGTMIVCSAASQTARAEYAFQSFYEFPSSGTGPKYPFCRLVQGNDGNFYGTSRFGGSNGLGCVFKIKAAGVVTPLVSFNGTNGNNPFGGLMLATDGMLYGTTQQGGTNSGMFGGNGTVFRITTNGVLTTLFSFNGTNGSGPNGPLAQGSDESLYGTTPEGTNGLGTIFRISLGGSLIWSLSFNGTNGSNPLFGLAQGTDGDFYGTTGYGGSNFAGAYTGNGTVFKVTTNGLLTTLVWFNGANGSRPYAGLALGSDGNFYGTTPTGGTFSNGTVFKMTPDGTLNTLASFDGTNGKRPFSGVAQGADGKFYGVTSHGTLNTNSAFGEVGTIYSVTTNGVLIVVARFDGTNAQNPFAELTLAHDGNLYAVTGDVARNPSLDGNVGLFFRLAQVPQITSLTQSNGNIGLSWSSFTNGTYRVEHTSSLSAANWTPLLPDFTATNNTSSYIDSPVGDAERYYRVRLLP